jgi:hypothetical protein
MSGLAYEKSRACGRVEHCDHHGFCGENLGRLSRLTYGAGSLHSHLPG